jgi:sugar (pentulose or hexulose) kinase
MTNKATNRLINIQLIRISGGLSNNLYLCQMIADLTQLTLIRANDVEASALGAIWCLAEHTEKIKPTEWLSHLDNVSFIAKEHQTLINRFEQWQNIMTKLTHSRHM